MANKPTLSVRRLINHTRNRSDDTSDSQDSFSPFPSSSPPSRKKNSSRGGLPMLGKVGSSDSGSSRRGKPLQISSPQIPARTGGDAGDLSRSASFVYHQHRRNVSEPTSSLALHKSATVGRGLRGMRAPPLMHQRPLKSANILARTPSSKQAPRRPPRPDEVLFEEPLQRRPSLKSISSDSFIQTRSHRTSLAVSDPGSIALNRRSKDDMDGCGDLCLSDDLRKFILEAEKAFQLEGSSLSRTEQHKASNARPQVPSRTTSAAARPTAVSRPSIPRKTVGSGTSPKRVNSTSRPLKPSATMSGRINGNNHKTSDDHNMGRRNSNKTPNQAKTIQKKPSATAAPKKKVSWETKLENKGSKWRLSEGVTEVLTGQRFKKTQVTEMLTPARLEKLKTQQEEQRRSTENLAKLAEDKAAEDEPFDPNVSWIDIGLDTSEEESSGPELSSSRSRASSPDNDTSFPPTPPLKDGELASDEFGGEIPIMFQGCSDDEDFPSDKPAFDPYHDALPPTPPPRSSRRLKAKKLAPPAPVSPALASDSSSVYTDGSFSPGPATPRSLSPIQRKLSGAEDEANIYLRSTPYTFTQQGFQHGAITFSKAEMSKVAIQMDDTMDWTAFQMAILGGAGDMGDVVDEWEDTRLSEDLVTWFDGHGFEDWGRVVMEEDAIAEDGSEAPPSPAIIHDLKATTEPQSYSGSMASASSSTSSLDSFSTRHTTRLGGSGATPPPLNIRRKQPPLPTLTAHCMPSNDGTLDSHRLSVGVRSSNIKSPARGPAIVGGGGPGDVEEEEADAPMGFNLNEDLGEYLQYEAEYAYATDL